MKSDNRKPSAEETAKKASTDAGQAMRVLVISSEIVSLAVIVSMPAKACEPSRMILDDRGSSMALTCHPKPHRFGFNLETPVDIGVGDGIACRQERSIAILVAWQSGVMVALRNDDWQYSRMIREAFEPILADMLLSHECIHL